MTFSFRPSDVRGRGRGQNIILFKMQLRTIAHTHTHTLELKLIWYYHRNFSIGLMINSFCSASRLIRSRNCSSLKLRELTDFGIFAEYFVPIHLTIGNKSGGDKTPTNLTPDSVYVRLTVQVQLDQFFTFHHLSSTRRSSTVK